MAIKNLQFIVTVAVDVPDDWECPTAGTECIEEGIHVRLSCDPNLEEHLGAPVVSIITEFETITD